MNKDRILVIGASGQIGTVLVENLRELFGVGDVIASDLRQPQHAIANFQTLDVTDSAQLGSVIKEQKITQLDTLLKRHAKELLNELGAFS
ncbi:MAG: NAD-dependent epimerase/dehydratase family protein [Proteobacteria bacterium]|nr:MAG: NAD-dependent epimerase/dehydratase family protein [Pseudomonadota bacterium]